MVELLVVMVLGLVIFGAILTTLAAALNQTTRSTNRVIANDAVTRTMERVTREIRSATKLFTPSGGGAVLTLHEYVTSSSGTVSSHTITWDCSASDGSGFYCTRQDVTAGTSAVKEISRLTSSAVFTPGSLPTDPSTGASAGLSVPITVTLSQSVVSSSNLVLSETVTPRDCQYAGTGYGQSCDAS